LSSAKPEKWEENPKPKKKIRGTTIPKTAPKKNKIESESLSTEPSIANQIRKLNSSSKVKNFSPQNHHHVMTTMNPGTPELKKFGRTRKDSEEKKKLGRPCRPTFM